MKTEMSEILKIAGKNPISIERVRIEGKNLAIEGEIELPPLAKLSMEDQVFIAAFIHCHGSIKEMERYLGVSYPTIKNRLKKLTQALDFVDISLEPPKSGLSDILDRLEQGELNAEQALEELK